MAGAERRPSRHLFVDPWPIETAHQLLAELEAIYCADAHNGRHGLHEIGRAWDAAYGMADNTGSRTVQRIASARCKTRGCETCRRHVPNASYGGSGYVEGETIDRMRGLIWNAPSALPRTWRSA